ncbi:MAG: T9SS type A sorting domain-containing protein [Bacteroidota bacterium]
MRNNSFHMLGMMLALFVFGGGLLPTQGLAQLNIERFVLPSAGGLAEGDTLGDTLSLSYTIGEAVTLTLVSGGGTLILTEGFQQHDDIFLKTDEKFGIRLDYQIYPNPATELLVVLLTVDKPVDMKMGIFDMRGRQTAIPMKALKLTGSHRIEFNVRNLADGFYLLQFVRADGQVLGSYKIQKLE